MKIKTGNLSTEVQFLSGFILLLKELDLKIYERIVIIIFL